jgi:hypothetical protein
MAIYTPTADEWATFFPRPIRDPRAATRPFAGALITDSDLMDARFAEVSVVVTVESVWPGLAALDDQDIAGSVRFSLGRWYIDDLAISRIDERGGEYDITLDRVDETDWVAHMAEKAWLYDPTDFFDVLEEARRLNDPEIDVATLDELMWGDMQTMLQRGDTPFFPSRMLNGNRVYLAHRMADAERAAFCDFLANERYAFGG